MGVMDVFDRAYVINLPYRTDRRSEMDRELRQAGIPLQPGKVELFPAFRPESAAPFGTIGEHGCFMSHYTILRQARELGLRNVLIMEDDLTISPLVRDQADRLTQQLHEHEWDLLYLGHIEPVAATGDVRLEAFSDYLMTAHFYAVHSRIYDRLIAFLDLVQQRPAGHPDGGPMPFDGALWTFRAQNPDVRTFIAVPNLGWQRSSRSDIAPRQWFDRWPIVSTLVGWLRQCKVRLQSRRK